MPKVTVIMPLYNAEKYVKETIDCILNQTFKDFELLIIDDCPTDSTLDVVNQIRDDRIRIIHNEQNRGIAYSRNHGLAEAKGEYIALMDDDDLTPLDRLEREAVFLDNNPGIGVVGGNVEWISEKGEKRGKPAFLKTIPGEIRSEMMFSCPMANSSTMFRKSIIDNYDITYKDGMFGMEDFRFWTEMSLHAQIVNFQDVLLYWRSRSDNESSRVNFEEKKEREERYFEILSFALCGNGFELTEQEKELYKSSFMEGDRSNCNDIGSLYDLMCKLISQAYSKNAEWAWDFMLTCRNHYLNVVRKTKGSFFIDSLYTEGFSRDIIERINDEPLVSVVIPTHNREDKIISAIESVRNQTYAHIEIVVVDDASTDNTLLCLEQYKERLENKDLLVICHLDKNGGPAHARNYGVSRSRGDYIAFHDDDDQWHPDKLAIQMEQLQHDKEIDMSFGQMARFERKQFINIVDEKFDWETKKRHLFQELLMDNYIGAPTIVISKAAFQKIGGFDENILSLEDWEFAIRASKFLKIDFVKTPLMDVHVNDISVTHNPENYIMSWLYIMKKYMEEAENKTEYKTQMLRHLKGNLKGSVTSFEDVLFAKKLLKSLTVPEIFKEPLVIETFFIDEAYFTQSLREEHLLRYKNVCHILLDTEDTIAKWLLKKGYKNVAIYGMGKLGKCLADRLSGTEIHVICGIDMNPSNFKDIEVISTKDVLSRQISADVIIITPLYQYDEIVKKLLPVTDIKCISIEDLLI